MKIRTDKTTNGQIKYTHRTTQRQTHIHSKEHRHRERQTHKHTHRQTHRQTDRQTDRHTDTQTHRQTGKIEGERGRKVPHGAYQKNQTIKRWGQHGQTVCEVCEYPRGKLNMHGGALM